MARLINSPSKPMAFVLGSSLMCGIAVACSTPASTPVLPPPLSEPFGQIAELPTAVIVEEVSDGRLATVSNDEISTDSRVDQRSWSEHTLNQLTLREKAGQLIMPWVLGDFAPEGSASHERIAEYVEAQGVGGVIMSVGTPTDIAAKLNDLQRHARVPLLVAADLETGAGFRMRGAVHLPGRVDLGGATDFPPLMAVGATGDTSLAYEMGRVTAIEARAIGVHVPFAPVLDVNNNPDNPIINVRSFGADPQEVSRMGIAFMQGIQDHGAIATGKHFPGHGDTDTDSHQALPVIRHDRIRMDSVELRPFQEAVDAGISGIMTAHISVSSLNGGLLEPSTLSPEVLTTLLREEMGFGGLVFTDAMDMSAIARTYPAGEATVRAIEAGADVILMPPNVGQAIDGIVEAVNSERISEERINKSVMRILEAKENLKLDLDRFVAIDSLGSLVGIPAHTSVADVIAERSITLLKNDRDLLPLLGTRSAAVMSVTFRRESDLLAGRYFNAALRQTYRRLSTVTLNADSDDSEYASVLRRAGRQALVVVGTYSSYAGVVDGQDDVSEFINQLGRLGVPHIVVSFGNPYLISGFPDTQAYMLAWSGSEASQRAAARALFGGFPITGQAPTSIPPLFEIGHGMRIPVRVQTNSAR